MHKLTAWLIVAAIVLIAGFGFYNLNIKKEALSSPEAPAPEVKTPSTITAANPSSEKAPQARTYYVNITNYKYDPNSLSIKAGDTVIWINNDIVVHTVSSDSGYELNSGRFSTGVEYSHRFNATGTYSYHCNIYPTMKGAIIVG